MNRASDADRPTAPLHVGRAAYGDLVVVAQWVEVGGPCARCGGPHRPPAGWGVHVSEFGDGTSLAWYGLRLTGFGEPESILQIDGRHRDLEHQLRAHLRDGLVEQLERPPPERRPSARGAPVPTGRSWLELDASTLVASATLDGFSGPGFGPLGAPPEQLRPLAVLLDIAVADVMATDPLPAGPA